MEVPGRVADCVAAAWRGGGRAVAGEVDEREGVGVGEEGEEEEVVEEGEVGEGEEGGGG